MKRTGRVGFGRQSTILARHINGRLSMFSPWKFWIHGFVALLIALAAYAPASAQTPTFSIEGVVSDEQQAVLPGVSVTVTNTSTGLTRAVITDTGGRYVIPSMPTEGRYRIQV